MFNTKLKRTSLALLLAVVLMLSLFPVAAYALEDGGAAAADESGMVLDAGQVATPEESAAPEDSESTPADDTSAPVDGESAPVDDHEGHDHGDTTGTTTTEPEKKFGLADIISLSLLGVFLIAVAVYCIINREKVGKLLRGLKSELKKIVWTPWNQVKKNTFVVLVIIIAAAIVIGALDLLFSKGILALGKIF